LFDLEMGQDFNGQMLEVKQNLAHLPESDLAAIVAYLKQIAPVDGAERTKTK
jgi:hypothetical protein